MSLKQLYPLHLFFFDCYRKALGSSSRADRGSFITKMLYPLHNIFSRGLSGALGDSSEADRGQFHQEKVISTASKNKDNLKNEDNL